MQYLLDTNVVSDVFRRHPVVLKHFAAHPPRQMAISSVSVLEIEYGMTRQPQARHRYGDLWAALQTDLNVLPFDSADAVQTAHIRASLAAAGTPIGPYDVQLAGMARARGLTLVTHNTAEFCRVAELMVVDWWSP